MQAFTKSELSNRVIEQLMLSQDEINSAVYQEMIKTAQRCYSGKKSPELILIDLRDQNRRQPCDLDKTSSVIYLTPSESAQEHALGEENDIPHITKREKEVLSLISKGLTYNEISRMLAMSLHTTNTHIKNIYKKLRVRSRGEATFEAMQLGLIEMSHN